MKGFNDNWLFYSIVITCLIILFAAKANKSYVDKQDKAVIDTIKVYSDSIIKIGNKTNFLLQQK